MTLPQHSLVDYAKRGPHPVGVTTLELLDPNDDTRGLLTDVWYPADPARFEDSAAADHPIGARHDAHSDAAPATPRRALPLVAFSHGNAGFRRQSTFLTSHLASWGMVVAAPDHTGNTFFEMLDVEEDERIRIHKRARRDRPVDLHTVLDAVIAGGRFPRVDADRIAVIGHSYGGWAALKLPALEPRIRAVCGLAPASEPFVGKKAFAQGELPVACPSLILSALEDVLVDIDTSIRPLFARLERSVLVGIRKTDHFHFCDHIALIHGIHEKNRMRPKQTRPTRAYAELLDEARTHRLVRAVATGFLAANLANEAAPGGSTLSADALASVDPHLTRLDEEPS